MAAVTALLLVCVPISLSWAGNIDIISRMDRSSIPYSGLSSSRSPLRRYRYPIYAKRTSVDDENDQITLAGDDDVSKRFLRGISLVPLPLGTRAKRLYGLLPRYDISIAPYDLDAIAKLYRNGRRKRTADIYDLKGLYRIYKAGKKRTSKSVDKTEVAADKRAPVMGYFDLLDMAKLAKAGKRSANQYHIWDLARMQDVGKRSLDNLSLLDLARLQEAGKRSVDNISLLDLARMHEAGKRSSNSLELWDLARMHEAGKRSIDSLTLLDLARMESAGKKRSADDHYVVTLAGSEQPERSVFRDMYDDADFRKMALKKKRSFDDYFGWDRKKKDVGEKHMVGEYLEAMKNEASGQRDKDLTVNKVVIKKTDRDDAED